MRCLEIIAQSFFIGSPAALHWHEVLGVATSWCATYFLGGHSSVCFTSLLSSYLISCWQLLIFILCHAPHATWHFLVVYVCVFCVLFFLLFLMQLSEDFVGFQSFRRCSRRFRFRCGVKKSHAKKNKPPLSALPSIKMFSSLTHVRLVCSSAHCAKLCDRQAADGRKSTSTSVVCCANESNVNQVSPHFLCLLLFFNK